MSITFSPGCNNTNTSIPELMNGSDICYLNIVLTEMSCTTTFNNVSTICQCDASDNCTDSNSPYKVTSDWLDYPLFEETSLICNGKPIAFPPTGSPNVSISGSCTYARAEFIAATTSTTASTASTASTTTKTSGGITLTKSNMLIAASLVLCTFIGSF